MEISVAKARESYALLSRLYQEQLARGDGVEPYLHAHALPEVVKHHVNVFCWYARHLPQNGAVLDWGCHHGPDSCLLRGAFGDRLDLHGCDFPPETEYPAFREFARLKYRRITNVLDFPYPPDTFDVVIASGVLEHAAMDLEALKALYTILKPGGLLVISYLPYRWSWREWYLRNVRKQHYHRRLYGRGEMRWLLRRYGFEPLEVGFQTFIPNVVDGRRLPSWARFLRRGLYAFFRHCALCCLARKVIAM